MANEKKGAAVNLRDTVDVRGIAFTDSKKQHLNIGKVYKVHPLAADNLLKTGQAVYVDEKKQKDWEKANPTKKAASKE